MEYLRYTLLGALILCAIITAISKKLLVTIIVFMAYSLMMSIIWVLLEAPDLAITEAAVGAGITSVLFFVTLRKIHRIQEEGNEDDE
ncbi:MAG: DUF4040 domain-containing protein [Ruminococcaceae bacterium]|nr:DUF4040 domain-containing protein [Oscillospiraceae bacterium]